MASCREEERSFQLTLLCVWLTDRLLYIAAAVAVAAAGWIFDFFFLPGFQLLICFCVFLLSRKQMRRQRTYAAQPHAAGQRSTILRVERLASQQQMDTGTFTTAMTLPLGHRRSFLVEIGLQHSC